MQLFISMCSTHKPREIVVFKEKEYSRYKEYIRSESELKSELKKIGYKKISLEGIIELYGKYNKAIADSFQPMIELKELYDIREYDRDKFKDGWNGRKTPEEYKEHSDHIANHGIKEYGVVTLRYKEKDEVVTAILGEGNHRLALGLKHGIKKMPIMFFYSSY